MYKNQLQELAQRSCFNLPSYASIREGPDHAPRFKACVNFNGEIFESPSYCTTLRQAEHSAAEVAVNVLSSRGPSRSLNARVLDETGIYKNLLQETAHRAGLNLPVYTTVRSGPGHVPIFTCTVELAGLNFTGESAKTKKQAEKNAAIAAWSALKKMPNLDSNVSKEGEIHEEQSDSIVVRVLSSFKPKDVKRRDQISQARKMVKDHKDNHTSKLPISSNTKWKLMGLLMENELDGSISNSNSTKNTFTSLLPPPPLPLVSKIIPTTPPPPSKPPLTQQLKIQRLQETTLQSKLNKQHQKHVEEWLFGGKNGVFTKPIYGKEFSNSICNQFHLFNQRYESTTQIGNCNGNGNSKIRVLGSSSSKPSTTCCGTQMGKPMNTIGSRGVRSFNNNPQRIAPAVQIRSVIPVCASPPVSLKLINPPTTQMKENSFHVINPSHSSSMATKTEVPNIVLKTPEERNRGHQQQPTTELKKATILKS